MRPGQHQQNRRGRGRNNGNNNGGNVAHGAVRKGQNPLSRSFESNGPDVKVRGTPAHIAEKYLALARDAQSSGDRVLAENYLQHAEHYNRIIMAYREQFQTPGEVQAGAPRRMSGTDGFDLADEMGDGDGQDDGGDDFGGGPQPGMTNTQGAGGGQDASSGHGNPAPQRPPQQQQPFRQDGRQDGQQNRYERNGNTDRNGDSQNRGDRPFRRDGQPNNNRFRDRNDRNDRNNRPGGNGNGQADRERTFEPREPRFDRGDRADQRQDQRPDQRSDQRSDQRTEPRGEFRQDRGSRPDRPVRVDRPEHGQDRVERGAVTQPYQPQPQPSSQPPFEPAPVANVPQVDTPVLPAFVSTPVPIPVVAPAAPTRRRERAVEPAANPDTPEFLRRPVRRTKAAVAAPAETTADAPIAPPQGGADEPSGNT